MPYKSSKAKIQGTKFDRRRKLSEQDKADIRSSGLSQRKLALMYNVSRRLIAYVLFPERLKADYQKRVEKGGSKQYYVKEKHTEAIKEHRRYKHELYKQGKIKIDGE